MLPRVYRLLCWLIATCYNQPSQLWKWSAFTGRWQHLFPSPAALNCFNCRIWYDHFQFINRRRIVFLMSLSVCAISWRRSADINRRGFRPAPAPMPFNRRWKPRFIRQSALHRLPAPIRSAAVINQGGNGDGVALRQLSGGGRSVNARKSNKPAPHSYVPGKRINAVKKWIGTTRPTVILNYGNAQSINQSISQSIDWYESLALTKIDRWMLSWMSILQFKTSIIICSRSIQFACFQQLQQVSSSTSCFSSSSPSPASSTGRNSPCPRYELGGAQKWKRISWPDNNQNNHNNSLRPDRVINSCWGRAVDAIDYLAHSDYRAAPATAATRPTSCSNRRIINIGYNQLDAHQVTAANQRVNPPICPSMSISFKFLSFGVRRPINLHRGAGIHLIVSIYEFKDPIQWGRKISSTAIATAAAATTIPSRKLSLINNNKKQRERETKKKKQRKQIRAGNQVSQH